MKISSRHQIHLIIGVSVEQPHPDIQPRPALPIPPRAIVLP